MLAAQATVQQQHKKSASESRLDKAKRRQEKEKAKVDRWFATYSRDNPSLGLSRDSLRALLTGALAVAGWGCWSQQTPARNEEATLPFAPWRPSACAHHLGRLFNDDEAYVRQIVFHGNIQWPSISRILSCLLMLLRASPHQKRVGVGLGGVIRSRSSRSSRRHQ